MEVFAVPSIPYLGVTRDGRAMNMLSGKWLSLCDNGHGYKQVFVCVKNKRYMRYVHRLVAECFIPNPNGLPEVNHLDGDKCNNSVENLEWCTRSANLIHAIKTGLKPPASEKQRMASSITGKKTIVYAREGWKKWAQSDRARDVWMKNIEGYNQRKHDELSKMTEDERRKKYNERKRRYYHEHIEKAREQSRERRKTYYAKHKDEILAKQREQYANRRHEQ